MIVKSQQKRIVLVTRPVFCVSLGQGIITFGCFGLEQQYVFLPLIRRYRRMVYGQHFYLPQWEELDEETKQVCGQFLKHHIAPCMDSVVKDIRVGFKVLLD